MKYLLRVCALFLIATFPAQSAEEGGANESSEARQQKIQALSGQIKVLQRELQNDTVDPEFASAEIQRLRTEMRTLAEEQPVEDPLQKKKNQVLKEKQRVASETEAQVTRIGQRITDVQNDQELSNQIKADRLKTLELDLVEAKARAAKAGSEYDTVKRQAEGTLGKDVRPAGGAGTQKEKQSN